jgi:transcriptional regulator with XRE-family HTH domain
VKQTEAFAAAGASIRALREQKGLSQERLSLEANVDQSSLSKVERLGPQSMGWRQLVKLAEALGCVIEVKFTSGENR